MTEQEYIRRAEALKEQLYRTAALYLGSPSDAVDAVDEAFYKGFLAYTKLRQLSTITKNRDGEADRIKEVFYLDNYAWDAVELELTYTSVSEYSQPVRVPMTAE